MSGSRRTIALLCGAAWFAHPAQAADSRFDPHLLVAPPLRPLRVVEPERVTLANGVVVFLLEDQDGLLHVTEELAHVASSETAGPRQTVR